MVKELIPFTKNYVYRQYFKEFYDFTDANIYGFSLGAFGIVINSLRPNINIPSRRLTNIKEDGLDVRGYDVSFRPSGVTSYSLCIVFHFDISKNFSIIKKDPDNNKVLLKLNYNKKIYSKFK